MPRRALMRPRRKTLGEDFFFSSRSMMVEREERHKIPGLVPHPFYEIQVS